MHSGSLQSSSRSDTSVYGRQVAPTHPRAFLAANSREQVARFRRKTIWFTRRLPATRDRLAKLDGSSTSLAQFEAHQFHANAPSARAALVRARDPIWATMGLARPLPRYGSTNSTLERTLGSLAAGSSRSISRCRRLRRRRITRPVKGDSTILPLPSRAEVAAEGAFRILRGYLHRAGRGMGPARLAYSSIRVFVTATPDFARSRPPLPSPP